MYTTRIRAIIFPSKLSALLQGHATFAGLFTTKCLGTVVTTKCVTVKTKECVIVNWHSQDYVIIVEALRLGQHLTYKSKYVHTLV